MSHLIRYSISSHFYSIPSSLLKSMALIGKLGGLDRYPMSAMLSMVLNLAEMGVLPRMLIDGHAVELNESVQVDCNQNIGALEELDNLDGGKKKHVLVLELQRALLAVRLDWIGS